MPNQYLQPGQRIADQREDSVTIGQFVNGASSTNGGRLKVGNILIGPTALASIGTNTTDIAGQFWLTDILIPYNRTITKIGLLQGGTATTDNTLVAIWDSYGKLVGSSAVAGPRGSDGAAEGMSLTTRGARLGGSGGAPSTSSTSRLGASKTFLHRGQRSRSAPSDLAIACMTGRLRLFPPCIATWTGKHTGQARCVS